jgi:antitoxin Phd
MAEAKKHFSEVLNRALTEGPQRVRRRHDAVMVLSERDYENLTGKRPDLKQFLLGKGPTLEDLDLTRDQFPMR